MTNIFFLSRQARWRPVRNDKVCVTLQREFLALKARKQYEIVRKSLRSRAVLTLLEPDFKFCIEFSIGNEIGF